MPSPRFCTSLIALIAAINLGGCTAIDLGTVAPPAIALAGACAPTARGLAVGAAPALATANIGEYQMRIAQVTQTLPPNVQRDPVALSISAILVKSALKGRVAGLKAADFTVQDEKAVDQIAIPRRLTHGQLTHFVKTLLADKTPVTFDLDTQRVALLGAGPAPSSAATLGDYLSAYYNGTYVDFYGTKLTKPTITMTISDQEIAAVLSVVLDYMIDSLKTVPVLTSDTVPVDGTTIFYLGGNDSKVMPTALSLKLATFQQIPTTSTKCEWTKANAQLLPTFATAAGDEAATVSGLVSQSVGGFEIGLGFLGKISIGDNQTLGTIVKTAASRTANRAALAALYWAVESRHETGG